jgi:hypothetical protein
MRISGYQMKKALIGSVIDFVHYSQMAQIASIVSLLAFITFMATFVWASSTCDVWSDSISKNSSPEAFPSTVLQGTFYGSKTNQACPVNKNLSDEISPKILLTTLGASSGYAGTSYSYSTSATDPDGDQVKYTFEWGDGSTTETGYINSGASANLSHAWSIPGTYNIRAKATDIHGATSQWSGYKNVTIFSNPPNTPSLPFGPSTGHAGISYNYSASSIDPDGDQLKFTFDWGDGTTSDTSFAESGTSSIASHIWIIPGSFNVRVKAVDSYAEPSNWSAPRTVTMTVKACC